MSEPEPGTARVARLRTAAYALAASAVGVPLIVLLLTQAVLLQVDPAGGRLGSDPIAWIPCAVAAVGMVIAIARVFTLLSAASDEPAVLRYPALIVQLQVGFTIAAIALLLLTPGLL
jgi:hypothetical protein